MIETLVKALLMWLFYNGVGSVPADAVNPHQTEEPCHDGIQAGR